MKNLLEVVLAFLIIILVAIASFAFAGEKEEKAMFEYELAVSGYTQYVGSVSGATFYDKFIVQPCFTVTHNPTGLYLNLWGSYSPSSGFNSDTGDEIDYIFGITRNIGSVNVELYYAYYNVVKLGEHGPGDVNALGTKIKFPEIWKVNPYLLAEYDWVRELSENNGFSYRAGVDFSPLENLIVDLSLSGHNRLYGTRAEAISSALAKISYEIQISEGVKLTPEMNFQKRLGYNMDDGGLTQDKVWGGITVTWNF